ncbi:MAG: hypothetical protein LBU44_01385, partial [Mediterranea sp.]|nr:hypothetical protein [Mediterranea sp.]
RSKYEKESKEFVANGKRKDQSIVGQTGFKRPVFKSRSSGGSPAGNPAKSPAKSPAYYNNY